MFDLIRRLMSWFGRGVQWRWELLSEKLAAAACPWAWRIGLGLRRIAKRRKLIVFLVPPETFISGGILSIFNLYGCTRRMQHVHGAQVFLCYYPGSRPRHYKFVRFRNRAWVYPFEMLLDTCRPSSDLLLHLPEYAAEQIVEGLGWDQLKVLSTTHRVRINVLNQNIDLMVSPEWMERLKLAVPNVTCTTAHPAYATQENRSRWGVPVHLLPAWMPGFEKIKPMAYEKKRDLMIVSPDFSPHREAVLDAIRREHPELEIRTIWNVKYEDYLKLVRSAKWGLTFGEGMDAYFGNPFALGGVGFAVFNERFFTPEYRGLQTVYPDYPTMIARIASDMRQLDGKRSFETYGAKIRAMSRQTWSPEHTRNALEAFYRGEYDFP